MKTGMVSLIVFIRSRSHMLVEICFSALKTWLSAMENLLSEDIDLNGITGFCVHQSNNNPDNHYLFIRTDTLAAHGWSYSIVWNI